MILLCRILISTALLGSIASTLSVYPHQLAYFNEASGGPENGHKHLLGSNLDWGQDWIELRDWFRSKRLESTHYVQVQEKEFSNAYDVFLLCGFEREGSGKTPCYVYSACGIENTTCAGQLFYLNVLRVCLADRMGKGE